LRAADHPFAGAEGLLADVGNTPLVPIRRAVADLVPRGVEIWGKCEWFNPGGSVKDRAALSMVLDAERRGVLTPGRTILDASSGNTGISYALIAASRGYNLKLCLPTNANEERKNLLRTYGAEIVATSPLEGSDGAIRAARALAAEHPDLVYLDQYGNDANWKAHYGSTGPEILAQTEGRVTHFVSVLGTSGTFMGTSRFLKDNVPGVTVCAVQPDSPFHGLEGLKHMETAIVPPIYDGSLADRHLEAPTEEAYEIARRLAKEDGILVGPSAAAAVWACVQVAQGLDSGTIVTILCDSGTRYLSESHIWQG
jgi:cysteine synthase B